MKIGNLEISRKKRTKTDKLISRYGSEIKTIAREEAARTANKYMNSQIRPGVYDYSGSFANSYNEMQDVKTYKFMRNLVSFLDASVLKRVLLLGDFEIYGEDDATTDFLRNYKNKIRENYFGRGWTNFMYQHADSVYATGIGLAERVQREDMSGALHLLNGNPEYLRFIRNDEFGYVLGYQTSGMFEPQEFPNQEFIYYTAFDKRYGSPKGYSLFHGLEFATQLQTRIMQSLHNNVWRIGDPTWLTVTKGEKTDSGDYDGIGPQKIYESAKKQLKEVAQDKSRGRVRDMHFYMPGDYDFSVQALGADGIPVFDYTMNSRVVIEQLITKTHLPPYAFGFYQWNSNFRMSDDQKKMLISAVQADRIKLDPIIERDFGMELFYSGRRKNFWWEWKKVDLTDMVDNARAGHLNAVALEKNVSTQVNLLWANGLINDNELIAALEDYGAIGDKTNKQKVLDNLGNIRKLALLGKVSQDILNKKTIAIVKNEG